MSGVVERARGVFNISPLADVPQICVDIVTDLHDAEQAYRDANSYGAKRDAGDRVESIHRRVIDMMTPPRPRCPHCGAAAR